MSSFAKPEESSEDEILQDDINFENNPDKLGLFQDPFHLAAEECVSLNKSYILSLAASPSWSKIAAGSSDNSVHLYGVNNNNGLSRLPTGSELANTQNAVVGVRFANSDENILYVGTADGTIFTYDLRQQAVAGSFKDTRDDRSKPITCIDLNANDRVLCAGTELVGKDSFLLFFDVRKQSTMGGYWESHSEDICHVRFHPTLPDRLASGSTDGLINVYDISQPDEDEALEYCMNTESSVCKMNWHKDAVDKDLLSCITHMNDVHIYDVEDSERLFERNREQLSNELHMPDASDCHVIDVHSTTQPGQQLVLAGSDWNKGKRFRSIRVDNANTVSPSTNFVGNKQIIRTSLFNADTNLLVTAGQSGLLSLWTSGAPSAEPAKSELKQKTKDKHRKHIVKPY